MQVVVSRSRSSSITFKIGEVKVLLEVQVGRARRSRQLKGTRLACERSPIPSRSCSSTAFSAASASIRLGRLTGSSSSPLRKSARSPRLRRFADPAAQTQASAKSCGHSRRGTRESLARKPCPARRGDFQQPGQISSMTDLGIPTSLS